MDYLTIRSYARENRKNPTPAEKHFWKIVRSKELLGLKINRQFVISYKLFNDRTQYFIADFYCHKLKLIIELDGRIHDYQKEYDKNRDQILHALGLTVLRFQNDVVLDNWSYVSMRIKEYKSDFNSY